MLSSTRVEVDRSGWFHSEGVQSLPLDLLGMARESYVRNLHAVLLRASGAPAQLTFVYGHDKFGFQVGLTPGNDPQATRRVGLFLDQPIELVHRSKEELWATARAMGVPLDLFEADYARANRAFAATLVTGWDVVRYLSLGGGIRNVASTEGHLVIDVSEHGLNCFAMPIAGPGMGPTDDDLVPDSPQHH